MTNLNSDAFDVAVVIGNTEVPIPAAIVKDLVLNSIDDGKTFRNRRFSNLNSGQIKLTVDYTIPAKRVSAELKEEATTNSLLVYLNNRIPDEPTRTMCRYLYEGDTFPQGNETYKVTGRIVDIWPEVGTFLMINAVPV